MLKKYKTSPSSTCNTVCDFRDSVYIGSITCQGCPEHVMQGGCYVYCGLYQDKLLDDFKETADGFFKSIANLFGSVGSVGSKKHKNNT